MPASDDEFDIFSDAFDDECWDAIASAEATACAQALRNNSPVHVQPAGGEEFVEGSSTGSRARQPSPVSSQSFVIDDFGDAELAAVDAAEAAFTQHHATRTPLSDQLNMPTTPQARPRSSSRARKHTAPTPSPRSPRRTPKRTRTACSAPGSQTALKEPKVSPSQVRQALEGYEEELTCPICCDILASAHIGIPCGHTFCGACGWEWISKNKRFPTCALCRGVLTCETPMVPNIAVDNLVDRHVLIHGQHGDGDWKPGGSKFRELMDRREKWKKDQAERAEKAKAAAPRWRHVVIDIDDEEGERRILAPDPDADWYAFHEGSDDEVLVLGALDPATLAALDGPPVPVQHNAGGGGRGRGYATRGRGGGQRGGHDGDRRGGRDRRRHQSGRRRGQ